MTSKLVALQVRAQKSIEQRLMDRRPVGDAGQGTLEYIGAILIAVGLFAMSKRHRAPQA